MKKIIKVISILFLVAFVVLYILFRTYTAPKSDEEVLKSFSKSLIIPKLTQQKFKNFPYRKINISKDTTLPTIVFVHGTIGSLTNFSKYLNDSLLQTKANMIAYDRIGYNYNDKNVTQESIAFETDLLKSIAKNIDRDKLIIVGYSYGGPIALAFKERIKKVVLLAPALYSEVEHIPWMLNFYKWKLTRWLVPYVWKQASKEKMSHKKDLQNFEESWQDTANQVISIHGENDWIVPFENSRILQNTFPEDKLKLITLKEAGHGLVWSDYKTIKEQLLIILD